MKKFLGDLFKNPDGSFSTKRTAGWLCLLGAFLSGFWGIMDKLSNETIVLGVFGGFLSGFLGSFGISSWDAKNYWSLIDKRNQERI